MKKLPSKFRTSVIVYFAGVASFLSKAMWNSCDFEAFSRPLIGQTKYWVLSPDTSYSVESSSTILSTVVKWIEIVLICVIFLVWIISYFKIRKIEDKELKSKKIKNTVITIIVLFVIGIFFWLCHRMYEIGVFDNLMW